MISDRPLPHNLEAERALLGGLLVSPEFVPYVRDLDADAFYRDAHGKIWESLQALDDSGSGVDILTLRAHLASRGLLDAAGGAGYLAGLVDGVPRSTNVEHYAAIVHDAWLRRQRIEAYRALLAACYEGGEDVAEVTAQAELRLAQLEAAGRRTVDLLDAAAQVAVFQADLDRDRSGPLLYLGLPAIDEVLEGVRPGEVLHFWARPGIGKTLVLCHAICSLVESLPVVCFSLEMPAAQIVRRLCRMAFGLTNRVLREQGFNPVWYTDRFAAFTLDATPGLSVAQMAARVRRLQAMGSPVKAVLIDHLGLVGGDRTLSTYDRVSLQAREIKELAKRLEVAVILLVQVNRDAGGDGSRELHIGSARDSGVVEETADYIVGLRRLDRSTTLPLEERLKFKDVIFAKVLKHRHGGPPDQEFGYQLDADTLVLREDLTKRAEVADIARIAARAGGGRRR